MGTSRFWFWWVWRAPDDARSVETLHFFLRKIFFSSAVYALPLNSSFQRGATWCCMCADLTLFPFCWSVSFGQEDEQKGRMINAAHFGRVQRLLEGHGGEVREGRRVGEDV